MRLCRIAPCVSIGRAGYEQTALWAGLWAGEIDDLWAEEGKLFQRVRHMWEGKRNEFWGDALNKSNKPYPDLDPDLDPHLYPDR